MSLFRYFLFILTNALIVSGVEWQASFSPSAVTISAASKTRVRLSLSGISDETIRNIDDRDFVKLKSENDELAVVSNQELIEFVEDEKSNRTWIAYFDVDGVFLGSTRIFIEVRNEANVTEKSVNKLDVTILRPNRIIDQIFVFSVVILSSIIFINFGAALSLSTVKEILRTPVGPAICSVCQFIFMPLASYGLGMVFFADSDAMALGLFCTGISPGGGASNMWTLLLGGNLDLSISMTTVSALASFATIPFWMFTLGKTIFDRANMRVPYAQISTVAIGLLIPLTIGLLIQCFLPRITRIMVRVLKPLSIILILFVAIFAIVTNFHFFKLFSWQIVVAGFSLPSLGYSFGWISSKLLKQSNPDAIAIAIETGIQNTLISIILLTFSVEQPMADLTTIVPVAVAMMTSVPLFTIYVIKKCRQQKRRKAKLVTCSEELKLENQCTGKESKQASIMKLEKETHSDSSNKLINS